MRLEAGSCTAVVLVGCCFQDLFKAAKNILVLFTSSFFSLCFVNVHLMHLYKSMETATAWKKLRFILTDRLDFYMNDSLSIAVPAFA